MTEADSARAAAALAAKNHFDLVISDIGLPDRNGYELFKDIRKKMPAVKGIALTGFGADEYRAKQRERLRGAIDQADQNTGIGNNFGARDG